MSRRVLLINPPVLAVDRYQVSLYAEAIPFGLLQIATYLKQQGADVQVLDMVEYLDGGFDRALVPAALFGEKQAGDAGSPEKRRVYQYGKTLSWLHEQLAVAAPPDEIDVTCCISFNFEPAHAVIQVCREHFPRATISFGGFYPSLFAEHARRSGADRIFVGRYTEADAVLPALDLVSPPPKIWLFRLVLGCRYRCSYCINAVSASSVINAPEAVADEVLRIHERWGVPVFSCWDPNVMLQAPVLEAFLDRMIERGAPVGIKFEMGIQPDLVTPPLLEKMKRAGVVSMTIPFESAEPAMMKRFGKPYTMRASMDAVAGCRALGFDTSTFHCTSVVGLLGESYRHIFRTYFAVLKAGGLPTPFPLSPTPGTREYETHGDALRGKDLDALNGHLWPCQPARHLALYDCIFEIVNEPDARRAEALATRLPPKARAAFDRELDWFSRGPHRAGERIDE